MLASVVLSLAFSAEAPAASHDPMRKVAELVDLELEQLTRITVRSVSRREQRLVEAPASVFVITAEDIRRSAATSIPEVLRLAPNLQVARSDANQYVVSARGGLFGTANKMLVLVDGRTVYTPLFSGVFYDSLVPFLEDIERIEVISGPGSTLWGTNAVNGVINITTKGAHVTRDGLLSAAAGNHERGVSLRQGWGIGAAGAVRAYARYMEREELRLQAGGPARDAGSRWMTGFRGDWTRGTGTFTAHAEVFDASIGHVGGERDVSGGHARARWSTRTPGGSDFHVQGYYDRTEREHRASFREQRSIHDVEFQHSMRLSPGHRLAWGAGYRRSEDEAPGTALLSFVPENRRMSWTNVYGQDEIALGAKLRATLGLRAERNSYTGWEWLPNARLSYSLSPESFAWAALTRTVRSPSRIDRDLVLPGLRLMHNDSFDSEVADVAEAGYRGRLGTGSISAAVFQHRYRRLRTLEPAPGGGTTLANGADGRVSGLEAWGDLHPAQDWRLVWGVAFLDTELELLPGRVNLTDSPLGNNPRRTASLRSLWNATSAVQVDLALRYVGRLPMPAIPSYTQLDARVGWRPAKNLELSLAAVNLLDRHVEFGAPGQRAIFRAGYLGKVTWAF